MELFDRTGRVRTPSPVPCSESEEDIAAASKGECDGGSNASEERQLQTDVVPGVGDEVGQGCTSSKTAE